MDSDQGGKQGKNVSDASSSTTASRSTATSASSSSSSSTSSSRSPQHSGPTAARPKTGVIPIKTVSSGGVAATNESEGMSESYHEIFDNLMPPELAKAKVESDMASRGGPDDDDDVRPSPSARAQEPSSPSLPEEMSGATNYLTSKLVEDSIRWQEKRAAGGGGGDTPNTPSPFASPVRRPAAAGARQGSQAEAMGRGREGARTNRNHPPLDPHCLLELERSAKHLATSVDEMTEQLSTLLHGISSVTVDTMETYRDGVCKTCDSVDTNIKTMYQVMAKVEELNKSMGPAYKIAEEVKDIKRVLDILEANVK